MKITNLQSAVRDVHAVTRRGHWSQIMIDPRDGEVTVYEHSEDGSRVEAVRGEKVHIVTLGPTTMTPERLQEEVDRALETLDSMGIGWR